MGDAVLVKLASLLNQQSRQADIVARLGGEEFIMLLPETDQATACILVERLREQVNDIKFSEFDFDIHLSASFGIVSYHNRSESLDQLIKQADDALYQAKHQGRNQTFIYSPSV